MVFPPFLGALQKKVILFFEVDFLSCFSQFWSADFPAISSCRRSSRSTKPPAWRRPKNGWTRCGAAWRGEPRMACCWKPMFLVASRCFKPKTSLVQSDLGSWHIMIIMIPKWLIYFAGDWTILIHIDPYWNHVNHGLVTTRWVMCRFWWISSGGARAADQRCSSAQPSLI